MCTGQLAARRPAEGSDLGQDQVWSGRLVPSQASLLQPSTESGHLYLAQPNRITAAVHKRYLINCRGIQQCDAAGSHGIQRIQYRRMSARMRARRLVGTYNAIPEESDIHTKVPPLGG